MKCPKCGNNALYFCSVDTVDKMCRACLTYFIELTQSEYYDFKKWRAKH
jgi:hypothetical protein